MAHKQATIEASTTKGKSANKLAPLQISNDEAVSKLMAAQENMTTIMIKDRYLKGEKGLLKGEPTLDKHRLSNKHVNKPYQTLQQKSPSPSLVVPNNLSQTKQKYIFVQPSSQKAALNQITLKKQLSKNSSPILNNQQHSESNQRSEERLPKVTVPNSDQKGVKYEVFNTEGSRSKKSLNDEEFEVNHPIWISNNHQVDVRKS